jgi:aspartate dehydrogenase
VQASRDGGLAGWEIAGVLTRSLSPDSFFLNAYDLIIEAAGPAALAMHGARALAIADVWTVSGTALADERLFRDLESMARNSGHRLRLVSGAIAGLDGIAAAAIDPSMRLSLSIDLPPTDARHGASFKGTVREAAQRFPDGVNVAVAAALAGPGLDQVEIEVSNPGRVERHRLALTAESRFGSLAAWVEPRLAPGSHPVAACLVAALRRELQAIWAG